MMLGARTGAWAKSGATLPYLRRVAHLESHGNEYIKTNLYPKAGWTFDTVITCLRNNYNCVYWGSRSSGTSSSENSQCYLNSNTTMMSGKILKLFTTTTLSDENWSSGISPEVGRIYQFTGITVVPTMMPTTYPIVIFGFNIIGSINTSVGVCRVGLLSAYENGNLIARYIPVLDISGRPAMYDEVSGQFFYNQGTGEFTWGELDG